MKKYSIYEKNSGKIKYIIECNKEVITNQIWDDNTYFVEGEHDPNTSIVKNNKVVKGSSVDINDHKRTAKNEVENEYYSSVSVPATIAIGNNAYYVNANITGYQLLNGYIALAVALGDTTITFNDYYNNPQTVSLDDAKTINIGQLKQMRDRDIQRATRLDAIDKSTTKISIDKAKKK